MDNQFSTVNVNTVPRKGRIEFKSPQMRVEFSANWNDTINMVTIRFNGQHAVISDIQNPTLYNIFSAMFADLNGKMEYPQDDAGIEVHTLQLTP